MSDHEQSEADFYAEVLKSKGQQLQAIVELAHPETNEEAEQRMLAEEQEPNTTSGSHLPDVERVAHLPVEEEPEAVAGESTEPEAEGQRFLNELFGGGSGE